jgi:hypothetical protein
MRRTRAIFALAARAPPPAPPRLSAAALRALLDASDKSFALMDARLADMAREKNERLADMAREKNERLADMAREKNERLGDAAARLAEVVRARDELLAVERVWHARELALAKHEADVARGIVNARGLFESALADIVRLFESRGRGPVPPSVSARLAWLFLGTCPEFVAYLKAAAADNSTDEKLVIQQARKLFDVLSERLHSGALASADAPVRMPSEVFERSGDPTKVAFAAFVAFAGRDLRLYNFAGGDVAVKLRAPAEVPGAVLV